MQGLRFLWGGLAATVFFQLGAWDDSPGSPVTASAVGAGTTAYVSVLSRADMALAKGVVSGSTALKGTFGETISGQSYVTRYLANNGNWVNIGTGQQVFPGARKGVDLLFLKIDPRTGMPRDLMVGEAKYSTSPLGNPKDGIQAGRRWNSPRLQETGNRYLQLSKITRCVPMPREAPLDAMPVVLKNGKTVYFWRSNSLDSWKIACAPSELGEAKKLASAYGTYIKAAGEGRVSYRSRLFRVTPQGSDLTITIRDASKLDSLGRENLLPATGKIKLPGALSQRSPREVRIAVAKALRKEMRGLTSKEIRDLSRKLSQAPVSELLTPSRVWVKVAANVGMAALIAAALDIGIQAFNGDIDYGRSMLVGSAAGGGALAYWGVSGMLMRAHWMSQLAKHLNCSAQVVISATSFALGGVVFNALYALGGWYLGYMDAESARRSAIVGIGGSLAGAAAGWGTLALVSAIGTASTGTPIAALGGAAAMNASLAFLGGGALSAGGGGILVGSLVAGGIVAAAGLGITAAIIFTYQLYDSKQETNRITDVCRKIGSPSFWEASWANAQAAQLIPLQ